MEISNSLSIPEYEHFLDKAHHNIGNKIGSILFSLVLIALGVYMAFRFSDTTWISVVFIALCFLTSISVFMDAYLLGIHFLIRSLIKEKTQEKRKMLAVWSKKNE